MTDDTARAAEQPEPLSREHLNKLVNAWAAGFVSGMCTQLLQGHRCTDPACPVPALAKARADAFTHLAFSDPAFRLSIERAAEAKWHDPDVEIGSEQLVAYPAAWNGGTS